MHIKGIVKKDKKTKNLISRLKPKDIAIISHKDLDEVAAISLAERKISGIINTEKTISGRYPNRGPSILLDKGIPIFEIDDVDAFNYFQEGDLIEIIEDGIISNGEKTVKCNYIGPDQIEELIKLGYDNIEIELDRFIENTLKYAKKEKGLVTGKVQIPKINTKIEGQHTLIVVRGKDYIKDLKTIKSYINEIRPVLIGVDGGGDALLEFGLNPDIIIGDMDSVSDKSLLSAGEVIVHGYENGWAPGLERVKNLGIEPKVFVSPGTSEDIALLLAYELNADLIVAVGTHTNMIDFLEKGRAGMASTFLVRLKVGSKLVDAKGVNQLYRTTFKSKYLIFVLAATLIPIITLILINPLTKPFITLLRMRIRILFSI